MTRKLNGWQRLYIIASVIWVGFIIVIGVREWPSTKFVDWNIQRTETSLKDCSTKEGRARILSEMQEYKPGRYAKYMKGEREPWTDKRVKEYCASIEPFLADQYKQKEKTTKKRNKGVWLLPLTALLPIIGVYFLLVVSVRLSKWVWAGFKK